ncbi:GLPGLI family protein [Psychroflexus sediminis]|uniref:GLPGLI family protein n=1 Tax=Psychroflexus sediminis TaxID=470826 RepID=A0A1G7X4R4_9FLAO|nr:GLPGLI family protein [Psychroflexus sediminis]SDG79194.1 GLPGLI family protein [Psychroflexus sediminis]
MKALILLIVSSAVLFCHNINAQTGIVNYGEVQSMEMGAPIGPDYKAMLVFDKINSLYVTRKDSLEGGHIREQKSYQASPEQGFSITVVTNPEGFQYYYNLKEKVLYSRDLGFRYVKDKTIDISWDITDETKKIGTYEVQKATAHFRGRDYTAWFTSEIPLPYGPWKLVGLPGLILEAYDTDKEIYWYFKNIEYPTENSYLLKPIDNPNSSWISFEELKERQIKSFIDARYGGRVIAENMGVSGSESKVLKTDSYIEVYEIKE